MPVSSFALLDTSIRLSVPYNHAPDYTERILDPYAELISEIYLPVHISAAHTSRPWHGPIDQNQYDSQVDGILRLVEGRGITLNFIANALYQPSAESQRLAQEIVRVHARFPTATFTLTSWELAVSLFRQDETLDIQPSTIAHVAGPTSAWYWKNFAGARSITVERSINRRPSVLRAIKKLGLELRMVANDDCLPNCPAEVDHGDAIRKYDDLSLAIPYEDFNVAVGCRALPSEVKNDFPWIPAQKEILPGHLRHLEGLVDRIKLVGRCEETRWVAEVIARYAAMDGLTHNIGSLVEPPEAWEKIADCDRACEPCGWCEKNLLPA